MNYYRILRILKDFWYKQIKCRINPRQKWATKVIPRTFTDIDYIIEEVVFAALVNYWENDDGEATTKLQMTAFDDSEEMKACGWKEEDINHKRAETKLVYDEMSAAYAWAKNRANKEKEIDDETLKIYTDRKNNINSSYDEVHKLRQEYKNNDTLHLTNIIKHRGHLWS